MALGASTPTAPSVDTSLVPSTRFTPLMTEVLLNLSNYGYIVGNIKYVTQILINLHIIYPEKITQKL